MRLAFVTAERASCPRKKVGAMIVRDRDKRVISGGYNGAPRGMPDCLEVGCEMRLIGEKESCVRTIHAESNALDLCGPLSEPHTLYCTVIPCRDCALRIIQASFIKRVVYFEYYESRGTKDVEALFAGAETQLRTAGGITIRGPTRVQLVKYDKPIETVKPAYLDVDKIKKLAWSLFTAERTLPIVNDPTSVTRRMFAEEIIELCHAIGVETEPPGA